MNGAGGFRNGEIEAVKLAYDLIWLMDDDGYCVNEYTLEETIKSYNKNKKIIINSYVLCDIEKKLTLEAHLLNKLINYMRKV